MILKSITLNYGGVPDLVAEKTESLVRELIDTKDEFNFARYNLAETPIQEVIEDALTIPFLNDFKVIVVKNSYLFTGEKPKHAVDHHQESLLTFLEQFDGPNYVIFEVNHEKLDERKKIVKSLKTHHTVNKIEAMSEDELKKWIRETLNAQFKDIKQDALEELIQLTGADYKQVNNELEKLVLFAGDEPIIVKSYVQQIVSRSLEQNVFLLTDYITTQRKKEAVDLLKDLIRMKEEPIKLLALISGQYRIFYQTKILQQKGFSETQIAKQLKIHPYRVKLAARKVARMNLSHLLHIIDRCADTDYALKSSYLDNTLLLELFILEI